MTKEQAVTILQTNICFVEFVKKNGEVREMVCTLKPDFLPETKGKALYEKDNLLTVFDVEKNDWRNINLGTLKKFEVVE